MTTPEPLPAVPRPLVLLGLAGILPQALCLALVLQGGPERWVALAAACCYAAVILSFLGGLWWMAALLGQVRAGWALGVAVVPSLFAWACLLPWCFGATWPGPSLVGLALALLASPLVDRRLAREMALPAGWLRLRLAMAGGLGTLTLLIATVA